MQQNTIYDLAIVGAGPAGSLLAWKLQRENRNVILLEATENIRRKVCGEYLCPRGVDILRKLKIADQILEGFPDILGMDIFTPQGQKVVTQFPELSDQLGHGCSVHRATFDRRLQELAFSVGVPLLRSFHVVEARRHTDFWQLRDQFGRMVRARALIGADGRKSFVARHLNVVLPIQEKRVALHVFLENSKLNQRNGEMHLFPNGSYIGLNPTGTHEVNFSLVCAAYEIRKNGGMVETMNHYIAQSSDLVTRFGLISSQTVVTAASPITHVVRKAAGRNWALVGDAAGFIDPLTGEGMYNAIWMADTLANCINESHLLFKYEHAFKRYNDLKNQYFREKSWLNLIFQKLIRKPSIVDFIAKYLLGQQERANVFIGVIGNIYSPLEGLKRFLTLAFAPKLVNPFNGSMNSK